jgi:dihydroorotase
VDALLIRGGRLVDPASRIASVRDLLISGDSVKSVSKAAKSDPGCQVIDASGCLVIPGLIDLHVHLREPGMPEAENVASGTRAAAAGGFTTVVCQPNTKPVLDNLKTLDSLIRSIAKTAKVRVLPAVALSKGLQGKQLSAIEDLAGRGARALSDDGVGTARAAILGQALSLAAHSGLVVMVHCEDHSLSKDGVLTAGAVAKKLRLPAIPAAAERKATELAIRAVKRHGGRLHVQHVSTAGALAAVRRAKQAGLKVTCEVTPHHLLLTDQALLASTQSGQPDPNLKMNPPLRTEKDRRALLAGLADKTIDAIATDHAPHTRAAKQRGFSKAPFGVTGLETCLALTLKLVDQKVISLSRAIALLSTNPARILGLKTGRLIAGAPADVAIIDPLKVWRVDPARMKSRSRNTAFAGWQVRGQVKYTLVAGKVVYRAD